MANVRKLMRMAREFEADEGRDLRGFIDAIAERDVLQEREGEAPLEAETLDAVRLMTIHRAKGLEFPVVAVGDLGKVGREDDGRLRISADGTTGMRLAGIGGGAVNSRQLDQIKAQQKTRSEEEERRIFYVAMTRAERHLILSGATDLEKLPEPDELCEPMRWVWRGFCAGASRARAPRGCTWTSAAAVRCAWPGGGSRPRPCPTCSSPRISHRRRPSRPAARRRPAGRARAGGRARASRPPGQPPELLGPRGLPALPLPLLPRAVAGAPRRSIRPRAKSGRGAHRASARCCAGASCTCCSRTSTSSGRGCRTPRPWRP